MSTPIAYLGMELSSTQPYQNDHEDCIQVEVPTKKRRRQQQISKEASGRNICRETSDEGCKCSLHGDGVANTRNTDAHRSYAKKKTRQRQRQLDSDMLSTIPDSDQDFESMGDPRSIVQSRVLAKYGPHHFSFEKNFNMCLGPSNSSVNSEPWIWAYPHAQKRWKIDIGEIPMFSCMTRMQRTLEDFTDDLEHTISLRYDFSLIKHQLLEWVEFGDRIAEYDARLCRLLNNWGKEFRAELDGEPLHGKITGVWHDGTMVEVRLDKKWSDKCVFNAIFMAGLVQE